MDGHNIEIVHMFFSGNCGTGKSHLVKVIYDVISKTLLYHYKDSEKQDAGSDSEMQDRLING